MKQYGTSQREIVFSVDEDKLNIDIIRQIRNYLTVMEKKINTHAKV